MSPPNLDYLMTGNRILRRLGRRGIMLTLMGAVYILLGVGALLRHPAPQTMKYNFLYLAPDWVMALMWFISGSAACVLAWRHDDSWGWAALYVVPFLRVMGYASAWIIGLVLGNGYSTAWYSAVLYLPFIAIVLVCSGWRENRNPPEPMEVGHQ